MTIEELEEKYVNIPQSLKDMKRWVLYRCEDRQGKLTKVPLNPISGNYAKSNDSITWSSFRIALSGCIKYNAEGLGFMLGDGIVGIDLDLHEESDKEQFDIASKDFLENLNTYCEYSRSRKGIHILCEGELPEGRRRKGIVEMYCSGRFFAMTGYTIKKESINNCNDKLRTLWEKYVDDSKEIQTTPVSECKYKFLNYDSDYRTIVELNDKEILDKVAQSKQANDFFSLYSGDLSRNNNDHSAADMAFCSMLAFWCNGDKVKMDRIFRSSGLMRPKWDEKRGKDTYGNITLDGAIRNTVNGYVAFENKDRYTFSVNNKNNNSSSTTTVTLKDNDFMNIDEFGEPIFRVKKIFKKYPLNDTGNALRFYDYFGDLFKYNKTDKVFMFWTGKTWIKDTKDIIRKYANKLIDILKEEERNLKEEKKIAEEKGEEDTAEDLKEIIKASQKNSSRVANKAGKDAMLFEFQSINDIAVTSDEFDKDLFLLNTDSGIVNLETGEISPFDSKRMMSKNTNTKVSYEEPITWVNFLKSIFRRDDEKETEEIVECIQQCLGYTLSASTEEQCMFILYGTGSNGKSTFSEQIAKMMGDYGCSTPSSTLMQQKGGNSSSVMYSIAKLQYARYVEIGETDDGERLAEATVKRLTGGDTISAQFKFGHEFDFKPKFKIWMSTNNRPVVRGTDFGIWRRMFLFPLLRTFTGAEKDRDLPRKLDLEREKILGWTIKGFQKFRANKGIFMPECLKMDVEKYKEQMDVISLFIKKQCAIINNYKTPCRILYQNYKSWAKDSTEFIIRESKFDEELTKKGIRTTIFDNEPCYVGIKLNSDKSQKAYVFNPYDGIY